MSTFQPHRRTRAALRTHPAQRTRFAIALLSVVAFIAACGPLPLRAQAQRAPAVPHLGYVYPAGARPGTTVRVVLGGQALTTPLQLWCNSPEITGRVLEHIRPMPIQRFNQIREQIRELESKRRQWRRALATGSDPGSNSWTRADAQQLDELYRQLAKNPPNRDATPAIAETVLAELTIPASVPPGELELRLLCASGLSNPLKFVIDPWPETTKPPIRPAHAELDRILTRAGYPPISPPQVFETNISIPATINGQLPPGGVDKFKFTAHAGQKLLIGASARRLIPYIADAVPGWCQLTLAIRDKSGKLILFADDTEFDPDPRLCFEPARDGQYVLEVADALYRGREDFLYRITLAPAPDSNALPIHNANLNVEPDAQPNTLTADQAAQHNASASIPLSLPIFKKPSAATYLRTRPELASIPTTAEIEPNDTPGAAQVVVHPTLLTGCIEHTGDVDCFAVTVPQSGNLALEVLARRLGSPLDSVLELLDASGRIIASNDDHPDPAAGLVTHQADSYLLCTNLVPGTYHVRIRDAQGHAGPDHEYLLRISEPRPDFSVLVAPSSLTLRPVGGASFTAHVIRRDGFNDDVRLAIADAPAGVTLEGGLVPAASNQAPVSLRMRPGATPVFTPFPIKLTATAGTGSNRLVRAVVPADEMMQAFAYRHLVPASELVAVMVRPREALAGITLLGQVPVRIRPGASTTIRFAHPGTNLPSATAFEPVVPVKGLMLGTGVIRSNVLELTVRCDATDISGSVKTNLLIRAVREPSSDSTESGPGRRVADRVIGVLPPIPIEILPPL